MRNKVFLLLGIILILLSTGCQHIVNSIEKIIPSDSIDAGQFNPEFNDIDKYKYVPRTPYYRIPFHRFPQFNFSEDYIMGFYQNEYYRIEIYDMDITTVGLATSEGLGGLYLSIKNTGKSTIIIRTDDLFELFCSVNKLGYPPRQVYFRALSTYNAARIATGVTISYEIGIYMPPYKNVLEKTQENAFKDKTILLPGEKKTGIIYYSYGCIDRYQQIQFYNIYLYDESDINGEGLNIPSEKFEINVPEERVWYWFFLETCEPERCGKRGYNYTGKIEEK